MKKTIFFIMILAVLVTGCSKKEKSKALNYEDSNPIEMVLQGPFDVYRQINVTSEYDITYNAINEPGHEVITVTSDGRLHSKNVGTAKVKIDNGYENMTVDVNVSLFREPTFEFGCNTERIRALYGNPYSSAYLPGDTILGYQYTQTPNCHGSYSYACGEMDFYFEDGQYFESDVYIRPNCEYLLESIYLHDEFTLQNVFDDSLTLVNYGDTLFMYQNNIYDDVYCGKVNSHNQWDEICLFYFKVDGEKSLASILKRLPRSSKLR